MQASQLPQVTYRAGSSSDTLWMRGNDGIQFGAWSQSLTVVDAPVVNPTNSASNVSHLQAIAASTLFTANDADGDSFTQYDFWNTGAGGGRWFLNGVMLGINQDNIVAAAQLGQVSYQSGAGTDTLWVRANDGVQFSAWSQGFTATDTAPVVTPSNANITVSHNNPVAASTLFTANDQDGDGIAQYDFWAAAPRAGTGYSTARCCRTDRTISSRQRNCRWSHIRAVPGARPSGCAPVTGYSTEPGNLLPQPTLHRSSHPSTSTSQSVTNNPVAASTLFTANDQDGDGIAQYDFWGSGSAGGHWLLNGTVLPNGTGQFRPRQQQLSLVTYQGGARERDHLGARQ